MTELRHILGLLAIVLPIGSVAALAGDITAPLQPASRLEVLDGTFTSVGAENWYRGYGTRTFTFRNGTWSLDFVYALDPEMQTKVFEFHTGGPYKLLGASAAVDGAYEAVFYEHTKAVTLRTADADLVAAMGMAGCRLTLDERTDISATGCAGWKPVSVCSEDHDLLAMDAAGKLFFGVRPPDNDMCTPGKRPKALLPAVVKR